MYRIFLVEDDETIAKLVRRHLEKWDYDVHVVQKFDAVMSEFASFDPHLVLMDIGLPFYNGYHWCTEIRRVSKVPVVFLSSAADNMNIVMAVSMGADDFIAPMTTKGSSLRRMSSKYCRHFLTTKKGLYHAAF